jgi:two-component system cell cycle sensor histidine kinase PleC
MEEISSMNEELQASNQQMEMLTFELEEARENLENIVKEKTKELQRAYKELQELDTLKSNFLHSISHEFKTPLTPLFGYLKLFKNKDLGELTPLQEQSIDIMLTCAEKLYNTIEDIILLARLDVEKEKYILKEVDLAYLLKNTLTRIEKELSEKKITLIQDIPNISIVIIGEQLMLIQTFLHTLRNSIKFTPERGTIRVILNQEEKNAVVRIIDTGTGLPEKIINEINEYLASQSIYTNKRGDAITIGLNLMKRVIIIHNASVRYKSEKGVGTEVIFTFPLKG